MKTNKSSEYIVEERRAFSMYTLQSRALPNASDGLKAAARRILWTGRKMGKVKSATLAGATMEIHPHAAAESVINTLASYYNNNIPLLTGKGAFGTLLEPNSYGAARYTFAQVSEFTKEVIFRDIDIVPMVDSYDGATQEPKHFLPLVPVNLLNHQEGIAVGFACTTLPRKLDDVISSQIAYLKGKSFKDPTPTLLPTKDVAIGKDGDRWVFRGSFERQGVSTVIVTGLPYGLSHTKYKDKLAKLSEDANVTNIVDDSSNEYHISITFKRGYLKTVDDEKLIKLLSLETKVGENFNVVDFDGEKVLSTNYKDFIKAFCDWRLTWFAARYKKLDESLQIDIQKYRDIILAIDNDVSKKAPTMKNRQSLIDLITKIGVVNIEYIASLPVYRFTKEEKEIIDKKLSDALELSDLYNKIINDPSMQREVYIDELMEIKKSSKKFSISS